MSLDDRKRNSIISYKLSKFQRSHQMQPCKRGCSEVQSEHGARKRNCHARYYSDRWPCDSLTKYNLCC